MSDGIDQLSVKDLLGGGKPEHVANYLIPMYQRNYAWGEAEITQLIQDVLDEMPDQKLDGKSDKPYYIGTLVVFRKDRSEENSRPLYEVIDGQQRLTTLFLLASYFRQVSSGEGQSLCGWFQQPCVRFESRPRSSLAMLAVFNSYTDESINKDLHSEDFNSDIIHGYELIQSLVPKLCRDQELRFADYLFNHVQIMRVQVPEDTELNHYFEIMNNRGEQLEKHEVLKSRLMSKLPPGDRTVLHLVWEATANMERYVQMGFNPQERNALFGERNWAELQPINFVQLRELLTIRDTATDNENDNDNDNDKGLRLSQLVFSPPHEQHERKGRQHDSEEAPERFNTVINFPNFLLQVLRVSTDIDIPLDDKQLIREFDKHILNKTNAVEKIGEFIYNLLKCKHLFDHYIIKREFTGNTDSWSLKRLKYQDSGGSNDYVNTFGSEIDDSDANRRVLMLLSAFHVSTPTMVYKYWLTGALHYLFQTDKVDYQGYLFHLESMARCFVFDRFLSRGGAAEYHDMIFRNKVRLQAKSWADIDESKLTFGLIQNNLVFNYLDYLLWLQYRTYEKVRSYEFTFRSSVEHFYPQKPLDGIAPLLSHSLDSFGNLCLISHSKNSRLSNLTPKAKKDYYLKGGVDSIKQWLMMESDVDWSKFEIENHNTKMLEVFKQDLGST